MKTETPKTTIVKLVPAGRKVETMRADSTRAKVLKAMNGKRTFKQIAAHLGITVEQVKAHIACNKRDKHIGYSIDTKDYVCAVLPRGVDVDDLMLVH